MGEQYITIYSRQLVAKVKVSDVFMIEQYNRKLNITTEDRSYSFYGKMENIEPLLNCYFFHSRKGCIVNLDKINMMTEGNIFFENGAVLPMARDSFIRTKQAYYAFISKLNSAKNESKDNHKKN